MQEFITRSPECYPPLVVNVTDGQASDADPRPAAAAIRDLATADGPVLLFNAHLSSAPAPPIVFPASGEGLTDRYARHLFKMSSPLPPQMLEAARADGFEVSDGARGFAFNADLVSVIRFLDIGTRVARGGP